MNPRVKLARAWAIAGKQQQALRVCEEIVQAEPGCLPAWRLWSDLLVGLGRGAEAVPGYARLLEADPGLEEVRWRLECCQDELHDQSLVHQPGGKVCLTGQRRFAFHRSGWNFALEALKPLHHRQGTLFDGFLENNFAWKAQASSEQQRQLWKIQGIFDWSASSQERGLIPYCRPWVGFLHNPHAMPAGYDDLARPQSLFATDMWKESLEHCSGLFTLSSPLSRWVHEQTGKPVVTLTLPSEIPQVQFDPQKFLDNPKRKVIQVGWWLRRLSSIFRLPIRQGYQKIWLVPRLFQGSRDFLAGILQREGRICWENTEAVEHLENQHYDQWLSENLVSVDLYDTAANCAVVECIARATPLLVNRLEAVEEYLGPGYPLYFDNLAEAAEKAMDLSLVCKAHDYLKSSPTRARLSGKTFLRDFRQSSIYQELEENL